MIDAAEFRWEDGALTVGVCELDTGPGSSRRTSVTRCGERREGHLEGGGLHGFRRGRAETQARYAVQEFCIRVAWPAVNSYMQLS